MWCSLVITAWFEVMDKEWPLWLVLLVFCSLGFIGFLLCRKKPWLSAVFVPLALVLAIPPFEDLTDTYVRPAIIAEAGFSYVLFSWCAIALGISLPIVGALLGKRFSRLKEAR